jgi:hypothetical protein
MESVVRFFDVVFVCGSFVGSLVVVGHLDWVCVVGVIVAGVGQSVTCSL